LFSAEIIPFGGQDCLLSVTLDFTEQKRLEEQLRQSQKMEALGHLAGGVAHDFNNLLSVIIGYSEILSDAAEPSAGQKSQVQQVQKAAQRAAALTRQLLAFSRKQVLQPTVLDVNAAVADMEKLLRRLIGENIEFVTRMDPALGSVRADRGQIEQVILNLCVNARDAMPAGGKLTIETANVNLDDAYVDTHPEAAAGPFVMLAVSDTAVGMDALTRAHIFEPFFTTKDRAKGTGLGLSTVYGIVKQSGGHNCVYSEPGRGTTFKLYLPRVDQPAAPSELHRTLSAPAGGSETILLVEDEESVRGLLRDALSARGYRVLSAPNAEKALEISQSQLRSIHILVTDLVMPGKGGVELAREMLRLRRDLKVLFLSGYTDNQIPDSEHGAAFLQKPFTLRTLTGKVRELLDARSSGS
jgi:nitrogen-specific signal transduction histidine kinase